MTTQMFTGACQFHGGQKDEHGFLVFCRKPAVEGYSYCKDHHRRIYQRAPNGSYVPRIVMADTTAAEPAELPVPELEREAA
ncbi:MAG TPA: hypothetical protein VKC64_00615 [Burkholderiales bacterium]|nr:hypothetical protein [Burkholderiales bacterium]